MTMCTFFLVKYLTYSSGCTELYFFSRFTKLLGFAAELSLKEKSKSKVYAILQLCDIDKGDDEE